MCSIEGMDAAIEFIEAHLQASITVQDIADAAGYSLYHFSRTFNQMIGHSPYDYLIRRRLSESARELLDSDSRIIDLALDYQFNNPETYARAFRRMFGLLPSEARRDRRLPWRVFRAPITPGYIAHINKGAFLKPRLIERGTIRLLGVAAWIEDGARPDAGSAPLDRLGAISNRVSADRYCIRAGPDDPGVAGQACFWGVEVASLDEMLPWLVGKTIPPLRYARFIHKGRDDARALTLDYIYQTWLPRSGSTLAAPFEMYICGEHYFGPDDSESESDILIPVR